MKEDFLTASQSHSDFIEVTDVRFRVRPNSGEYVRDVPLERSMISQIDFFSLLTT